MKTLLILRSEKNRVFDASTKGNPIRIAGDIVATATENILKVTKGYLEPGFVPELGKNGSFTVEATIKPDNITGARQNIIEAEQPAIALFIDKDGYINGSVNILGQGWKTVKSTSLLPSGKLVHIVFTKDENGKLELEIDGNGAGSATFAGNLSPVGTLGFRIGTWVDGTSYQYKGEIGNVCVRAGVFTSNKMTSRIQNAKVMEAALKGKLGPGAHVYVSPSLDESHARLLPVKDVMNAAGVEKISDLSTLRLTVPTTITKGKVLVAPKKSPAGTIDLGGLVAAFAAFSPAKKREFLAKYLVNRNSKNIIKSAGTSSGTIASRSGAEISRLTSRIDPLGGSRTGLRIPREALAVNPTLEGLRVTNRISDFVKMDHATLSVVNKEALLKNLESFSPENLPQLSTAVKTLMMQILPVNSSVIIAGTFDLTNTELIIDPDVEKLYIIAETMICGTNAKITWKRPGGTTPDRLDNPGLNGQGLNGKDGVDGKPGDYGIDGAQGRNAPSVEIWVKNLTNIPSIDLNGEDGIKAGKGQKGGNGSNGTNGKNGTYRWIWTPFGNIEWCDDNPTDGGDGGNGGRGGNGGKGGSGGSGGKIIIGVLDGTLSSTVTAGQFLWKNQGGQKGRGGNPGQGGTGGRGGHKGYTTHCDQASDGHDGSQGQPGVTGADGNSKGMDGLDQFFEFSEEAWDDMLTRPWITEISPSQVFPGNNLIIRGSRFSSNDTVIIEGVATLTPTINPDESLSVTVPGNISGGTKSVFVRRAFDNTESNRIPIRVKPQLDILPAALLPDMLVKISGKAFLPHASVLINGNAVPGTVNSAGTEVTFTMIGTGGAGSSGGTVNVAVRNTDGLTSNIRTAVMPHILEIPFVWGTHNLPFGNFTDGVPTWGTYQDTFGSSEVWHEQLDPIFGHPILTAAYYGFYHYFLKGEANGGLATGFCTSLSALVADKLWQGINDANSTTKASMHTWLTAVHGKLLSRESLINFHDQGQQGALRVEITARAIERTFLTGCDRNVAPLLFFIPSGSIWDSGYFGKLGSTHCIMPHRFVYPDTHTGPQLSPDGLTTISSLDGVKLYCWDCNHPDNQNCRLEFRMVSGSLQYTYFPDDHAQFDIADGITLGLMTLGDFLITDHDLPFSGPFGLTSFIIDFLLSPADLQITNEHGLRTGTFNNMIFSEIPNSHPVYLAKGAYLTPVGNNLTRKFVGNGTGKYTFNSLMPDGTTIKLEEVATKPGHTDTLIISSDASQLRFTPHEQKDFTVTYSKLVGDQVRALAISGAGAAPGLDLDITVAPDMSFFRLGNRDAARNVTVRAFSVDRTHNLPVNKNATKSLPTNHDLVVMVSDWNTIDLNVETISFD